MRPESLCCMLKMYGKGTGSQQSGPPFRTSNSHLFVTLKDAL